MVPSAHTLNLSAIHLARDWSIFQRVHDMPDCSSSTIHRLLTQEL